MLSKEEIGNKINLKNKTKYTIEKSKEIMENHKEDNCDCSIETSLAYDMQYVEKYINQLEKENKEFRDVVNIVNKEKEDWIRGYQEEKDRQFKLLNSYEDLKEKANKYDSLIEKINNKLEYAENLLKETAKGKLQRYTPSELIFMIKIYKELLRGE